MNKNKSFTLIELLVVIVIIGILAGVIMISTSSSIDKANFAKAQAFSSTVKNELLSNLVSEWTFDEGTDQTINRLATDNDVKDTWGSNNGTVYGNPQIKGGDDCVSGRCMSFDGDDYVSMGDKENLSFTDNRFTISFWGKPLNTTNMGFLGKRGLPWEYSVYIKSLALRFQAWTESGAIFYEHSISDYSNEWAYFVWTANGSQSYLYKNGKLIHGPFTKKNETMSNTTASFEIGRGGDGAGTQYMKGSLDDIRIYNAALSSSQIKQNYIAGLNLMLSNGNISNKEYNERINELAYDK
ncbi:MAG: LamG-like jellyroll fold domain-containing protein [Minisyncoccales bacterium]|jgi:prepilin-type N-terminal cleavage/methylation domain-containing protein